MTHFKYLWLKKIILQTKEKNTTTIKFFVKIIIVQVLIYEISQEKNITQGKIYGSRGKMARIQNIGNANDTLL